MSPLSPYHERKSPLLYITNLWLYSLRESDSICFFSTDLVLSSLLWSQLIWLTVCLRLCSVTYTSHALMPNSLLSSVCSLSQWTKPNRFGAWLWSCTNENKKSGNISGVCADTHVRKEKLAAGFIFCCVKEKEANLDKCTISFNIKPLPRSESTLTQIACSCRNPWVVAVLRG